MTKFLENPRTGRHGLSETKCLSLAPSYSLCGSIVYARHRACIVNELIRGEHFFPRSLM
uniref:Uncharacterized protein n=1 Tax=Strix occidentalis caurina TaxID=311401 RepID=A0A8D0KY13_STROC